MLMLPVVGTMVTKSDSVRLVPLHGHDVYLEWYYKRQRIVKVGLGLQSILLSGDVLEDVL